MLSGSSGNSGWLIVAVAIVMAGMVIAGALLMGSRYEYTSFDRNGPSYVVKHDRWTGKSCLASGLPIAVQYSGLPLCQDRL